MSGSIEDKRSGGNGGPVFEVGEVYLAGILKLVPDAIIAVDEQYRILIFNKGAEEIFGYRADEVLGRPLEMLMPDRFRPDHGRHIQAFSASSITARYMNDRHQITGRRKNGEEFPAEASITKFSLDGANFFATVLRDISTRKKMDEDLARRDSQLSVLSRASQNIYAVLDVPEIKRALVDEAKEMVGADSGATGIFMNGKMRFTEYNKAGVRMPIDLAFEKGYGVPGWVIKHKKPYLSNDAEHDPHVIPEIQQKLKFYKIAVVPILSRDGELLGCFEVHDRKDGMPFDEQDVEMLQSLAATTAVAFDNARMLQKIKRAEDHFRKIFENSLDAVFLLNPKQDAIIDVNPAVPKMLGFSRDELLSMPMSALHPKETPALMAFAVSVFKNGHGTTDSLHCLTKSGAYKDAEMSASLMEVEGEALMIVSVRDVTERKKTDTALRESEEQVHRLLDSTGEAIYGLNLDGNCTFANPACARMLGYENTEQLLGKNMHGLIHHTRKDGTPYPVKKCRIYKTFREGKGTHVDDEVLWRADGSSFPVEYRSYPTKRDGRIIGSVVTFTDISERMQAEDELRKYRDHLEELVDGRTRELAAANERLQELDKLKSMFIASMSHELRTPLNSIIGFSGIVLQGMDGKLNTQQSDHLGRVNRSAKHLLTLITDVIDISKVEAGKIQTYAEAFMLHELVEEAVSSLKAELDANGLDMEVDVPPTLEMKTDRKRLLQCLLNYLSNAVKFTEAGKITVSAREADGMVEMAVTDTGIGISEKDIPRLFTQFSRIDSPLMRKTTGTGLGLYLTRKLAAEVLGGEVAVISTYGKGSTFSLRIPKQIKLTKRGGG